ncbi:DMT family transporter [Salininema proteolyticum]|uniref:DMT family transporter n=1 Tax=Salininema proteolyticum TaxID=1607685 RepID=A0ABV8U5G7_9ACTN
MKKWSFLAIAIAAEVAATMSLRASVDSAVWIPVMIAFYITAFAMLGLTLRIGVPIGVAYGVWAAGGVALTALLGAVLFGETLGIVSIAGIALIAVGVVLIEGGTHASRNKEEVSA